MGTVWKVKRDLFELACSAMPKYKALADVIEQAILAGELEDQQKLPAQRHLADELAITHGTVTRAYDLLEQKMLVVAKLGAGTYVDRPMPQPKKVPLTEYDFSSSMQPMFGQQTLVKHALQELAADPDAIEEVMTYASQGVQKHKNVFLSWLALKQIEITADDLIFTQGAQQGIYTCLQVLTTKNDYLMHEALAYPGFFRAVDASGLNPLSVPITPSGIDLDFVEGYCQQHQPKALYITPNMQNPTNIQYKEDVLDRLVVLSQQYDFYIIEDDVNYCLPEDWRAPLQQRAADRVFYLSSLSKYFAGGLRVAFALVPPQWQHAFNLSIHSQSWMVSTMNIELATRFIVSEGFKHNQMLLAAEARYRQEAFAVMAARVDLNVKRGGLNTWLLLPNSINMNQLAGFCATRNIKVRTADLFTHPSSTQAPENALRVALGGFNSRECFDEGVAVFERAFLEFGQQQDVII